MNFASFPPCRSTTGPTPSKKAVMTWSSVSGSSRSPSPVESTTSEKRIVTTRRKRSAGCSGSASPQARQNLARSGFSSPQTRQIGTDRV